MVVSYRGSLSPVTVCPAYSELGGGGAEGSGSRWRPVECKRNLGGVAGHRMIAALARGGRQDGPRRSVIGRERGRVG